MAHRRLDVTAYTTLDHVDARAEGDGWTDETVGVVDVESPEGESTVWLGLELDPTAAETVPPHADYASLAPEQARALAAALEEAATAAERGEAMTSGRG